YLNPFDHFVKEIIKPSAYLRYCDDFLLVSGDERWLKNQLLTIENYLDRQLHLAFHPNKIHLRPWHYGIDWLGYVLFPGYCLLRPNTRRRMWRRVYAGTAAYLAGGISRKSFAAIAASYDGVLKYSRNSDDRKYLNLLVRCF
ncbi:MAG: hypothetical protein AAB731_01880, partial [Patescibacteria group bacterium]